MRDLAYEHGVNIVVVVVVLLVLARDATWRPSINQPASQSLSLSRCTEHRPVSAPVSRENVMSNTSTHKHDPCPHHTTPGSTVCHHTPRRTSISSTVHSPALANTTHDQPTVV